MGVFVGVGDDWGVAVAAGVGVRVGRRVRVGRGVLLGVGLGVIVGVRVGRRVALGLGVAAGVRRAAAAATVPAVAEGVAAAPRCSATSNGSPLARFTVPTPAANKKLPRTSSPT